jgi:hypothetical protein
VDYCELVLWCTHELYVYVCACVSVCIYHVSVIYCWLLVKLKLTSGVLLECVTSQYIITNIIDVDFLLVQSILVWVSQSPKSLTSTTAFNHMHFLCRCPCLSTFCHSCLSSDMLSFLHAACPNCASPYLKHLMPSLPLTSIHVLQSFIMISHI